MRREGTAGDIMKPMSSIFQRVLLTGGAGFIGSHLTSMILALHPEATITIVDSLLTGNRRNIQRWLADERVEFLEQDLTDFTWLQSFLRQHEADPFTLILHFASPASPPRYQAEPIITYLVNSQVTHYLAQYAYQQQSRMVFASTSEVYGDPQVHPQPESYWGNVNPNGERSCYDEAKRLGETICGVHVREFGADIRLIRIFNTYGPHMDLYDGRVIPSFCLHALRGEPLPVFGDGQQTRSFCYVEDLVNGILAVAQHPDLAGETINLGNPGEFTMLELIEQLEILVGHDLPRAFHPLPADDPTRRRPDISRAKLLLDWEPQITLAQGLHPTFAFFERVLQQDSHGFFK